VHIAPTTLEGRHVRLEPVTPAHAAGLFAAASDDATIFRWFTIGPPAERAAFDAFVADNCQKMAKGEHITFVTRDKASGEIVGSSSYGSIDRANRRLEIGWTWIKRSHQRTPVNTEAKLLMLENAFERLGCIRVEFKTHHRNEASRRALARIGAIEEGTFRNHMIMPDGSYRHSVYFSVIDSEWPEVKAKLQSRLAG
jgi:RimJ/RimL family protein N-acetyltransferase